MLAHAAGFGLIVLLTALTTHPSAARAEGAQSGEADDGGVHVAWTIRPLAEAGEPGLATLEVRLSEGLGGAPLRLDGGQVAAWLQRRRSSVLDAEENCADRVKALTGPGLGARASLDLNDYRLVTLNTDRTLAIINPFVGLSGSKLESITELPGTPRAWLTIPERAEAWVALDEPARLLAFDLQARRIARTLDLPGPARTLGYDPASRRLWLAFVDGGLASLDIARPDTALSSGQDLGTIALFSQPQRLGEDALSLPGVVSLHRDGTVILHGNDGERRWILPEPPAVAGYSPLARTVLVAARNGTLFWLDLARGDSAVERKISIYHDVSAMSVFDGGRRALLMGAGRASVVDLAQGTVTMTLDAPAAADALLVSERFIYAIGASEGRATLWSIADLRAGKLAPVSVQLGRAAPGGSGAALTVAAPGGDGLLFANPTDGAVYRYNEGMMAPSGNFSNYRRAAIALDIFDPSVREVAPGFYRGVIRAQDGGAYTLVLAAPRPRFQACASVELEGGRPPPTEVPKPRPAFVGARPADRADPLYTTIEVRLDPPKESAQPVDSVSDLTLLVFDRHSGWQERVKLRRTDGALYEAEVRLPRPGRYDLLASSISANLGYTDGFLGALPLGGARP
ncbi:hypothetical protein MWN34_10060 [Ancylobacter sp. 6x-1]|uniref:Uncharacterized protein n=1 Tax=Ancylobacter crimeensis TaxID=2579147 RepID=A0ABT0DBB8_9HYPH|nr:hypothetical protein [Ancylobacter crimeensis]MCK0197256.1 hypothetical protein [Ancylobacter crimeensis]